ncbi:MAG: response regulator [Planctomycetes bacterium]|nr:response regulator [Planctomycetota bacterium]
MQRTAKVLVVDDDESIRNLVATILTREDCEVITSSDGAEALTIMAEHEDIELVVLDWMMPVMDGLQVLNELGKQDSPPPVLMLTALSSRKDVERALKAGAVDYVQKPLNKDSLVFKVNAILERTHENAKAKAARRKPVSFKAKTGFTIVNIDAKGIALESSFPVRQDSVLFLESDTMAIKLDLSLSHRFALKVLSCNGKGNRHRLDTSYVGLTPQITQRIQKLCLTGWR